MYHLTRDHQEMSGLHLYSDSLFSYLASTYLLFYAMSCFHAEAEAPCMTLS